MQEMKHNGKISHQQQPSIKLIKGQKNTYGWEIKVFSNDTEQNLKQLEHIDNKLKEKYYEGKKLKGR